jgi:oligopeptide/dipeptide ABC transporter ATP-binding protein
MYAGKIVEWGSVRQVFKQPLHPYTMGLQLAFPRLHGADELVSIPGSPPNLVDPPPGCRFAPRCPFVVERCRLEDPPLIPGAHGHMAACHRIAEASGLREQARDRAIWLTTAAAATSALA